MHDGDLGEVPRITDVAHLAPGHVVLHYDAGQPAYVARGRLPVGVQPRWMRIFALGIRINMDLLIITPNNHSHNTVQ